MGVVVKETLQGVIYVYLFIAILSIPPSRAGDNSLMPNGTVCTCPGDEVIYECSVCSGAATLWSGTVLDCRPGDITLRHMNFQQQRVSRCNGNITSEIVGKVDNCYISRLEVAAIAIFNDTSVDCSFQTPNITSVEESTLYILQEPSGFKVSSVNMTGITISWTENSFCTEFISYNVASNCSSVTCTTRRNEATCSNLPIATMCSFSIRSNVCEPMLTVNNAITVTLRRPQANITPVYSPRSLSRVIITIYPEPFLSIPGDDSSPVIDYSFSYSDAIVSIPGCHESEVMCQRSIDITCPQSGEIDVTLSAMNMLGRGPATDPTTIGCTNEFVRVEYDSAMSTITCNFLNETDTSIKSCSQRKCDQTLASSSGQNSTVDAPNTITLTVATGDSDCYLVTANSSSFSITVEVRTSVGTGNANTNIAIGISVGVVAVVIIVLIATLLVIVPTVMTKRKRTPTTETVPLTTSDIQPSWKEVITHGEFRTTRDQKSDELIEQFELQEVPFGHVKIIDIYKDYELEELAEEVNSEFKICVGRSFCLFKDELENISEERNIAFLQEIKGQLFFASNLKSNRSLLDRIKSMRKMFDGYKVFVENFESDEKKLKAPTSVLYEVQEIESKTKGIVIQGSAAIDTEGADIHRGIGATNGQGNTGGTAGDGTKRNNEIANESTPV